MYPAAVITGANTQSDEVAVGAASAQFANITAMAAGQMFMFVSSTACWIKQGSNPTASAAPGSMYVPANTIVFISGANGVKLAVIQDAAGGKASLTQVQL
jgi:streptogramin lyase